MRKIGLIGAVAGLLFVAVAPAMAQQAKAQKSDKPGVVAVEELSITGRVVAINQATRSVTLRGPEGNLVTLDVDKGVKSFDQVKVGDLVEMDFLDSVALYVGKSGQTPGAGVTETVALAPKGAKPAGLITKTTQISATVTAIDYKNRLVTLKGPQGNSLTFNVSDEVKRLNEIKKGDQIVLQYSEALVIRVHAPDKD